MRTKKIMKKTMERMVRSEKFHAIAFERTLKAITNSKAIFEIADSNFVLEIQVFSKLLPAFSFSGEENGMVCEPMIKFTLIDLRYSKEEHPGVVQEYIGKAGYSYLRLYVTLANFIADTDASENIPFLQRIKRDARSICSLATALNISLDVQRIVMKAMVRLGVMRPEPTIKRPSRCNYRLGVQGMGKVSMEHNHLCRNLFRSSTINWQIRDIVLNYASPNRLKRVVEMINQDYEADSDRWASMMKPHFIDRYKTIVPKFPVDYDAYLKRYQHLSRGQYLLVHAMATGYVNIEETLSVVASTDYLKLKREYEAEHGVKRGGAMTRSLATSIVNYISDGIEIVEQKKNAIMTIEMIMDGRIQCGSNSYVPGFGYREIKPDLTPEELNELMQKVSSLAVKTLVRKESLIGNLRKSIFNHHQASTLYSIVGQLLVNRDMPKPCMELPDSLEEIRLKTSAEMVLAGKECGHCIGGYIDSNNIFFRSKDNVCAEVYNSAGNMAVMQCFSPYNKTTTASKKFAEYLKRVCENLNKKHREQLPKEDGERPQEVEDWCFHRDNDNPDFME